MKDELDMIFSGKDTDIEKISARYKAVDDKRKEKIYEISKRKYDILKAGEGESSDDGFIVSAQGVERYSRPKFYRYFSAAAAAVVLFGGICGGVMLSRSSRVQPMNSSSDPEVTATTVAPASSEVIFSDNEAVDKLVSNLEMLEKPQYPDGGSTDISEAIYFNKDDYAPEVDKIMNLTKYYYAVTDERIDTVEEIEALLDDTFIYESRNRYMGGDLSGFEVGYDFRDDSMANKYVKTFINYNGKIYAQSLCAPAASISHGFESLYNFSNYKLVSSEFKEGGELLAMNRIIYDEEQQPVPLDKLVTCARVYERPDGEKVKAEIELLPEDGVWKIAEFWISLENEDGEAVYNNNTLFPVLEGKDSAQENAGKFGELQLHEQLVYPNFDEAVAVCEEIDRVNNNGGYEFKRVDVEKYTAKILEASDYNERNTLENKSYIYHLMLNSSRYFDTADLTYYYKRDYENEIFEMTGHCLADNAGRYIYVDYKDNNSEPRYDTTMCMYNNMWINSDNIKKTYIESEEDTSFTSNSFIPDNYRVIDYYNESGDAENYAFLGDTVFGQLGRESLYPSTLEMHDFDGWHIERTEDILGRQCAVIEFGGANYIAEKYVDLRTGIVLKSTEHTLDINEACEVSVKSVDIDKPLEYIYFDPTGYTKSPEQ
ncbi:hypothetical protein [Ruminococcus sp.]|uniref:hypothetical protein n=1 Tax=Ruminococcus sp. TaxID=41978 RepID=UPI0025D35333|nr:hypothetical protein [Ruminococcus sp.]MCR4638867.1 hypothetical protein [Ruminococcus sp.]